MSKDNFNSGERRKFVRIDTGVPVRFKISWTNTGKIYSAATRNISQGGVCLEIVKDQDELVETLASLPEWPTIEVSPLLPDFSTECTAEAAWITSRVNWIQKPTGKNPSLQIGLDFVEMADDVRKQIYDFILGKFVQNYNLGNA